MKPHVQLTRAIGSEFLTRKLSDIRLIFAIGSLLALTLVIWLVTVSVWWWLLAVHVIAAVIVGVVVLVFATLIVRLIRPRITKDQNSEVKSFVDKLERVAENVQTPVPIIVFRVLKDVILTPEQTYVERVAADSTSLHTDLIQLRTVFANP